MKCRYDADPGRLTLRARAASSAARRVASWTARWTVAVPAPARAGRPVAQPGITSGSALATSPAAPRDAIEVRNADDADDAADADDADDAANAADPVGDAAGEVAAPAGAASTPPITPAVASVATVNAGRSRRRVGVSGVTRDIFAASPAIP